MKFVETSIEICSKRKNLEKRQIYAILINLEPSLTLYNLKTTNATSLKLSGVEICIKYINFQNFQKKMKFLTCLNCPQITVVDRNCCFKGGLEAWFTENEHRSQNFFSRGLKISLSPIRKSHWLPPDTLPGLPKGPGT